MSLNRRDLLKGAAAVGGTALTPPSLIACAGSDSPPGAKATSPTTIAHLYEKLDALISGRVIVPSDATYESTRLIWNARFDDVRPAAVVRVADVQDVATTVTFAREHGLGLRVRNGGHSFAGYSIGDSVVIDTRPLDRVQVNDDATSAQLGAGLTNLEVYRALWSERRAIPGGLCPTVGITGLATGGGLGAFGRAYGLTCDSITAFELVTADGHVLQVDQADHPDLFWAVRGGGGGNFGVITSLTFDLLPVEQPFTHATYAFPWSAASSLVHAWQEWLRSARTTTWCGLFLMTQDPAHSRDPVAELEIVHAGPEEQMDEVVRELLAGVGQAPSRREVESGGFLSVETDFYCKGFQPDECRLADAFPSGKIGRPGFYVASNVSKGPWPSDGIDVLLDWLERRQRDRTLTPEQFDPMRTVGKMFIEPADGAIHEVAADATAFVHRDAMFVMQYQARWMPDAPSEVVDANIEWVAGMYRATEPYRSGFAYQNYIDPLLENWQHAYYGDNLGRLRDVKRRVDPDGVFSFPQSIPRG
jgi:FAD/FMN-containing dehydrogenase